MSEKKTFKKVLVIDDNDVDLYIAELCLKYYSSTTEIVLKESAKKALDYLLSLKDSPEEIPDLIFLDIRMPEIDGFGFLDAYSNLPEVIKKESIVMMLSSSLNQDDHDKVSGNRFVDRFLTKPLTKEKLDGILQLQDKAVKSQSD